MPTTPSLPPLSSTSFKEDFPLFQHHPQIAYLDSAASAQKPKVVLDAMNDFYTQHYANPIRGVYSLSERSTALLERAREKVAKWIGAEHARCIVFTKNTTEALNLAAYALWDQLPSGGQIITTRVEHHANFLPWQRLGAQLGLGFSVVECDDLGVMPAVPDLPLDTRLFAFPAVSNVTGQRLDIEAYLKAAQALEAITVMDAAQLVPHDTLDVAKLKADFVAFSGHKIYAPMGVGVLYISPRMLDRLSPMLVGGGMVSKADVDRAVFLPPPSLFEAGTLDVGAIEGLHAALEWIESKGGYQAICDHMLPLSQSLLSLLQAYENSGKLKLIGEPIAKPSGIYAFSPGVGHAHDIASLLGARGVCVRAGHHCAMPLQVRLNSCVTVRVSLGVYNDLADLEKLDQALSEAFQLLG